MNSITDRGQWRKTGVMCLYFLVLVESRAAEFSAVCRRDPSDLTSDRQPGVSDSPLSPPQEEDGRGQSSFNESHNLS